MVGMIGDCEVELLKELGAVCLTVVEMVGGPDVGSYGQSISSYGQSR